MAFRGTKDPMDVLTDISFVSQGWDLTHTQADGEKVVTSVKAHAGECKICLDLKEAISLSGLRIITH